MTAKQDAHFQRLLSRAKDGFSPENNIDFMRGLYDLHLPPVLAPMTTALPIPDAPDKLTWWHSLALYEPQKPDDEYREAPVMGYVGILLNGSLPPLDRLNRMCPPSIALQISPDRYYAAYLFPEPALDVPQIEALQDELDCRPSRIITPTGAVELPRGWVPAPFTTRADAPEVMLKPPVVRLAQWNPSRRYTASVIRRQLAPLRVAIQNLQGRLK